MRHADPMIRALLDPVQSEPLTPDQMTAALKRRPGIYPITIKIPRIGIGYVEAALAQPVTGKVIERPIIDRTRTIPYGAGGSVPLEEPTTYIDHRFPRSFTVRRLSDPKKYITFSPDAPLVLHENLEQTVMEALVDAGFPHEIAYKVAHFKFAEVAEGAWYKAHDIDQGAAERAYLPHLKRIQEGPANDIPNDLYHDPYPHDHPWAASHEAFGDTPPTAEEVRQALTALRMRFAFDDYW